MDFGVNVREEVGMFGFWVCHALWLWKDKKLKWVIVLTFMCCTIPWKIPHEVIMLLTIDEPQGSPKMHKLVYWANIACRRAQIVADTQNFLFCFLHRINLFYHQIKFTCERSFVHVDVPDHTVWPFKPEILTSFQFNMLGQTSNSRYQSASKFKNKKWQGLESIQSLQENPSKEYWKPSMHIDTCTVRLYNGQCT